MTKCGQRLKTVADNLSNRQHGHRKDPARNTPHPEPEDERDDDEDRIEREPLSQKHWRQGLALNQMKSKIKSRRKQRLPERVMRCYWIRLFTSLPWHSHSCRYRQSDAYWLITKIADRASVHFMHFRVKGTLCENRQLIQRTLVTFPPGRHDSFRRFRGRKRAVVVAFRQPLARNMGTKYPRSKVSVNAHAKLKQLTLNQRVQGSSPCAPTNNISYLRGQRAPSPVRNNFLVTQLVTFGPP